MPRGQPDFGMYAVSSTIARIADMGELAVRLGSIDTFDRRGDLVWFDDFESDVHKWLYSQTGSGGELVASAERAKNSAFSAKLSTGSASANLGTMTKRLPYQVLSRIGFEISFTLNDNLTHILFNIFQYDGAEVNTGFIRFLLATNTLEVNDNGIWREVATNVKVLTDTRLFNTIKLVGDFGSDGKYVRVILNETEYDISAYSLKAGVDVTDRHLSAAVELQTGVTSSQAVYIDDVIITQNEP